VECILQIFLKGASQKITVQSYNQFFIADH